MRKKTLEKRMAAVMLAAVLAIPAGLSQGQARQVKAAENLISNGSFEGAGGASNGAGWSLGSKELKEAKAAQVLETMDVMENGDFEITNNKWACEGGSVSYEEDSVRSGSRAAVIERQTGKNPYFRYQEPNVVLVAKREYTVTYWIRTDVNGKDVKWNDVLQNTGADSWNKTETHTATTEWTKYTYTFTAANEKSNMQVGFQLVGGTGNIYIDDVSVTYAVPKEETIVTTIVSEDFESGTINTGNWAQTDATVTCAENQGRNGGYAAVVPRSSASVNPYFNYTSPTSIFEIGKEYKVTYWARSEENIEWNNVLLIVLDDNKWNLNGRQSAAAGWQEYSYTFTAKKAETWPQIGVQLCSGTGTLYFDDFSVVKEEKKPVYIYEDGLVKVDDSWKLKLSGTSEAVYSNAALTPGKRYLYSYTAKPKKAAETGSYGLKAGKQILTAQTGSFVAEEGMEVGFVTAGTEDVYFDDLEITVDENDIGARLAGYTVSLGGNIGMNFYMELSDEVLNDEGAYMKFIIPGKKETTAKVMVSDVKNAPQSIEGKSCYVFSCDVAAKDMAKDIKAQFFCGDGKKSQEYTYSVKEYAEYMIANESKYKNEEIEMVKAMLNYGAYAQEYFNYNTEKLANSSLAAAEKQLPDVENMSLERYDGVMAGSVEGLTYYGSSLMLTGETAIRHYFTLEDGNNISDYTFTIGQGTAAKNLTPAQKDGRYYVEISNIAAHRLSEADTVSICKNGAAETCTVAYSAYSYAKTVLSDTASYRSELKNVMKALYQYCEAAKALADSKEN